MTSDFMGRTSTLRWWEWRRRRRVEKMNRLLAFNEWIDATAPDPELAEAAKQMNAEEWL